MVTKRLVENDKNTTEQGPFIYYISKQGGWVGGVGQLLTFTYMVGGWVIDNADWDKKNFKKCGQLC